MGRSVVRWLQQAGHDATHLLDQGLERLPDGDILRKATAEGRILLTFDLDFGEILASSRGQQASIMLFRPRNARTPFVIERLRSCLPKIGPVLDAGAIVVVEDARVRVRHWPPVLENVPRE